MLQNSSDKKHIIEAFMQSIIGRCCVWLVVEEKHGRCEPREFPVGGRVDTYYKYFLQTSIFPSFYTQNFEKDITFSLVSRAFIVIYLL